MTRRSSVGICVTAITESQTNARDEVLGLWRDYNLLSRHRHGPFHVRRDLLPTPLKGMERSFQRTWKFRFDQLGKGSESVQRHAPATRPN